MDEEINNEDRDELVDSPSPPDRFNLVYITFSIIGLANLIPWNFFTTAKSYFQYQLRNTSLPNNTDPLDPKWMTRDQRLFENYVALCMMFPLTVANFFNLGIQNRVSASIRFLGGSSIMFAVIFITVVMTQLEVSASTFLGIALSSIVFMNVGCALTQGSLMGVVSTLPSRNICALLEGQAFAGILAASANILVISLTPNPVFCGLAFFAIALSFIALSIILWISLSKNAHFQYFWKRKDIPPEPEDPLVHAVLAELTPTEVDIDITDSDLLLSDAVVQQPDASSSSNFFSVMKEVLYPGICVYIAFVTTLSLYPSVLALIQPHDYETKNKWTGVYFIPVTVFFSFNVCDYIGRGLGGYFKWPRVDQPCLLGVLVLLRVILIPLVLICNQQPRFHIPALLLHDAFPIIFVVLIGLTNGHIITVALMYAPYYASPSNKERAGVAMSVYIALGLSSGVALSFGLVAAL